MVGIVGLVGRIGLIAGTALGSTVTPPVARTPSLSGTAQMESTLTATANPEAGAPNSWRWERAPWNGGSPSVWTPTGDTDAADLLDFNDKLQAIRVVAVYGGVDYPSDFLGPVAPYYSFTGITSGAISA